ncbi:Na(+)/H(+) exchange regulatory cofactor NHE-RF3 [Halotydeus destructor]|nr:Na(+)/H(+) exchange regulatory cofactor NHE-RF3 [Halotydeus destructor]
MNTTLRLCVMTLWPDRNGYGFSVQTTPATRGFYHTVQDIQIESPAYWAGLQNGDQVVQINGEPVYKLSSIDFDSLIKLSGPELSLLVGDQATLRSSNMASKLENAQIIVLHAPAVRLEEKSLFAVLHEKYTKQFESSLHKKSQPLLDI